MPPTAARRWSRSLRRDGEGEGEAFRGAPRPVGAGFWGCPGALCSGGGSGWRVPLVLCRSALAEPPLPAETSLEGEAGIKWLGFFFFLTLLLFFLILVYSSLSEMGGCLPTSIRESLEKVCKYVLLHFYYFVCIYTHPHTHLYVCTWL